MLPRPVKQSGVVWNLQALRAVAALAVVCFHLRIFLPAAAEPALYAGNAGVDIFFVISGFIIALVAGREQVKHPGRFLATRFLRVVPLYWLLTLVSFVLLRAKPGLAGNGGVPTAEALVRSLLFIPYRDHSGEMHPIVFVGWTLNFEMAFYLLFAVALILRSAILRACFVSGILVLAVGIGLLHPSGDPLFATYTDPLVLEFVAGVWLCIAFDRFPDRQSVAVRGALTSVILIAVGTLIGATIAWPDGPRILIWGCPAILIVTAALMLERGGMAVRAVPMLMLGAASYAIYLSHTFVIKMLSVSLKSHMPVSGMALSVGIMAGALIGIAVAGVLLHLLVEVPLTRLLRRRLLPSVPKRKPIGENSIEAALIDPAGASV